MSIITLKLNTARAHKGEHKDSRKVMPGGVAFIIFLLLFTILACISLSSCRTQYIELPSSHSSIDVALRRDSITRDHYCYIFLKGDTVYKVDSIREYVEHSTTDTIVRVDSVSYPVPVPVPGDMTKRQQFLYNSGIAGWIILIAALIIGALIAAIKIFTHK